MKLYKKKNLTMTDGMLVTEKGKLISPDPCVVLEANELETLHQKTEWYNEQPEPCAGPNFSEFERESAGVKVSLNTLTLTLDEKIAEAQLLMQEIDHHETAKKSEEVINKHFSELLKFVTDKKIVGREYDGFAFDTPQLGNPLKWDQETIIRVVVEAVDAGLIE